jgi:hypothetical protein
VLYPTRVRMIIPDDSEDDGDDLASKLLPLLSTAECAPLADLGFRF